MFNYTLGGLGQIGKAYGPGIMSLGRNLPGPLARCIQVGRLRSLDSDKHVGRLRTCQGKSGWQHKLGDAPGEDLPMAKQQQLYLRMTGEVAEVFERCRTHIIETKRAAGLDTKTSVSEVLRHALNCLDEKHRSGDRQRQPKRAV